MPEPPDLEGLGTLIPARRPSPVMTRESISASATARNGLPTLPMLVQLGRGLTVLVTAADYALDCEPEARSALGFDADPGWTKTHRRTREKLFQAHQHDAQTRLETSGGV